MPDRRVHVERIDEDLFRIVFGKPLKAEVALMYFGFYPNTQLLWSRGRVAAVIASAATFKQVVADFGEPDSDEWTYLP